MKGKFLLLFVLSLLFICPATITSNALEVESDVTVDVCLSNKNYTYIKSEYEYKGNNFEINYNKMIRNKQISKMGREKIIVNMLALNKSEKEIVCFLLPNFDIFFSKIKSENEVLPINAEVTFLDGRFIYSKEKSGLVIDETSFFSCLLNELAKGNNITIKSKLVEKKADITIYDLKQKTKLRSKESTSFASSEEGRRHNLLKAMSCFNNLVVQPNERVSFNKITGEKSYESGYKDAMVILNGEFVKGVGGGVCQASSTIYNAALMAGLKIVEVHNHSLPVYYVPLGFDAMVSEYSDLVFENNTGSPIYFKTYASGERVYAEVYGANMKGVSYKKVSKKIRDIETKEDIIKKDIEGKYSDKITYKGEFYRTREPRVGYEVNAYLQEYNNGKLVSEKLIRREIYAAQKGVVYEGACEKNENE